ncbi:pentapeptide repeat-containing protein [Nonomuraea sp. NPDC001023]|uniref:pentapeptide repeat-containing protein n=1 Tax=unclassified Nonomuraea TaxID=2593643 RepID=UPI00332DFDB8
MRLDLTGAVLIHFDLSTCRLDNAVFDEATFTGAALFGKATFTGNALFGEATFTCTAWFYKASFSSDARFDGTTFTGDALFGEATFSGDTLFDGASGPEMAFFDRRTRRTGDRGRGAGVASVLAGGGNRERVADAAPGGGGRRRRSDDGRRGVISADIEHHDLGKRAADRYRARLIPSFEPKPACTSHRPRGSPSPRNSRQARGLLPLRQ